MYQYYVFIGVFMWAALAGCNLPQGSSASSSIPSKSKSSSQSSLTTPNATDGPKATEGPSATEGPKATEINSIITANPNILNFETAPAVSCALNLGFKQSVAGIRSYQKSVGVCDNESTISIRSEVNNQMICVNLTLSTASIPDSTLTAKEIKSLAISYPNLTPNTSYILRVGRILEKDTSQFIDYPFTSASKDTVCK